MNGATRILTGAEWVLRAVSGPGGRDHVYGAQCTTCKATSGQGADEQRSVGAWAIEHTNTHPGHRSYVSVVSMRWSVAPAVVPAVSVSVPVDAGRPVSVAAARGADPAPRKPAHHAARPKRRRAVPGWLVRAAAFTGRFAGPLYLAGVCIAIGVYLGGVFLLGEG